MRDLSRIITKIWTDVPNRPKRENEPTQEQRGVIYVPIFTMCRERLAMEAHAVSFKTQLTSDPSKHI